MRTIKTTMAVTAVLLLAVLATTTPAGASVYNGTVEIDCTQADAAGTGSHVLDRDNTGSGQEALNVLVTDGLGTVIYELDFTNVLGTFAGGIGTFAYTTPPAANPITFTLTSIAGNGLPAQVDYVATGVCEGLIYAPPTAEAPTGATAGETITVTGSGCPEGPVTVRLLESDGTEALATAEGVADGEGDFAVDLTVPAGAVPGEYVIEVWCGDESEPTSEVTVLGIDVTADSTSTTPEPSTTSTTAAADNTVRPRFTG
jgi:hypothetical protein